MCDERVTDSNSDVVEVNEVVPGGRVVSISVDTTDVVCNGIADDTVVDVAANFGNVVCDIVVADKVVEDGDKVTTVDGDEVTTVVSVKVVDGVVDGSSVVVGGNGDQPHATDVGKSGELPQKACVYDSA